MKIIDNFLRTKILSFHESLNDTAKERIKSKNGKEKLILEVNGKRCGKKLNSIQPWEQYKRNKRKSYFTALTSFLNQI